MCHSIHVPLKKIGSSISPRFRIYMCFQSMLNMMEGGLSGVSCHNISQVISIRTSCEGSITPHQLRHTYITFQSTLPVRGATQGYPLGDDERQYFDPRSPWGERPRRFGGPCSFLVFQSTLPVGGATAKLHSFSCVPLAIAYIFVSEIDLKMHTHSVYPRKVHSFFRNSAANLPGIFCLLMLRFYKINVSSGR